MAGPVLSTIWNLVCLSRSRACGGIENYGNVLNCRLSEIIQNKKGIMSHVPP